MKPLTEDQIRAVYEWMRNWAELRDSIIPMDFLRAFSYELERKESKERPPLGLKPRNIHDEERKMDILNALIRYSEERKAIPLEWLRELMMYIDIKKEE